MELHEIIRQRRAELNMSQSELAAKVGVDKRQIRRYESGENPANIAHRQGHRQRARHHHR